MYSHVCISPVCKENRESRATCFTCHLSSVWDPKGWNGMGKWSDLALMYGSYRACAVGIDGGGLVVMGGGGVLNNGCTEPIDDVKVLDGKDKLKGSYLPKLCWGMSGVVHDGVVYVMGGTFMGRSVWSTNISDLRKEFLWVGAAVVLVYFGCTSV